MEPFPSVVEVGGRQPDLAAARNVVAAAGVVGPDGVSGPTEALAFGLAGGVGFLYGVFEYGDTPTMTIVARNESTPDPFLAPLFDRVGAKIEVQTTTGAATASKRIDALLTAQIPMLCTVGAGLLPYLGLPATEAGMSPHVVGVIGGDDTHLLLDDRSPEPHVVERSDFASAQAACRSAKHRTLTVESIAEDLNWPEILRTAVREGAVGFDTPPVPQFAANVGISGLRKWSELLMAAKGPKRWTAIFGADRRAAIGLTRLYDCLNHAYTTPAASRPLHATFLREAASISGESRWVSAADLFDQSATRWQSISDRIVAIDPAIARYGACSDERAVGMHSRPEPNRMATLYAEQDEIVVEASLDAATAAEAYRDIGLLVTEIADLEAEALSILR